MQDEVVGQVRIPMVTREGSSLLVIKSRGEKYWEWLVCSNRNMEVKRKEVSFLHPLWGAQSRATIGDEAVELTTLIDPLLTFVSLRYTTATERQNR